jgi:glycerol-3-phosphate acyltransferase PlsY
VTELILKVLLSYLLGSVIGSLVLGRLRGVDIRKLGSGNPGGTNALRTQGKMFAIWVMLIDVGKGWLAARVLAPLGSLPVPPAAPDLRMWLPVACGGAAILGHVFPLWYGFRGGKGIATCGGVLLGMGAWLLVPVLAVWLVVLLLTGFVSLASITAAIALPVSVRFGGFEPQIPMLTFGIGVALLVIYTHRENIRRLKAGTEHRAQRVWLFGRGSSG